MVEPRERRQPIAGDLGPAFMGRVRTASLVLGGLLALSLAVYAGYRPALASLAGLAVSLVNIRLLQSLFTRVLVPGQQDGRMIAFFLLLKVPVLVGGTWLALGPGNLPATWYALGFSVVLLVAVLKVVGILLTGRRGADGRWHWPGRAILLAIALAGATSVIAVAAGAGIEPGHAGSVATAAANGQLAQAGEPAEHGAAVAGETGHPGEAGAAEAAGEPGHEVAAGGEAAAGHAAAAEGEEEAGEKSPELPNIFELLHEAFPHAAWAKWLFHWQNPIFSTLVIVLLCIIAAKVYRRREMIPGPLQNAVEMVVEGFSNFILGILGPRGKEFIPFLGTLFLYIWWNNLLGLIPFGKSPTSVFTTTVSLAICVFCYVQYTGITKLGIKGYVDHLLGEPRDVVSWCMVPLILPLHVIGEIAKPLSLSLRLFGNIMGEDVLLGVFAMLGVSVLAFTHLPIGIPLHLPFILLSMLLSTIQALVFTLLSTIYFLQMMPHEHEEGHGDAHGAEHGGAQHAH